MGNDTNDESNANKPTQTDYEAILTNAWVALDRAQQERGNAYRSWRNLNARKSPKAAARWAEFQAADKAARQAADFYDAVQLAMIAQQARGN